MNKQMTRAELLASYALEGNPNSRDAAARDLLDAVAALLKDADEAQMANEMSKLMTWEIAPFRDCNEDDCDAASEHVCALAERIGDRFASIADRVSA